MESVRRLRLAKGLTMKELASMVDVTESQISQIETGKRNPGFETLLKLGEALECTVEELIRNEKDPATESDGKKEKYSNLRKKYDQLTDQNVVKLEEYLSLLLLQQSTQDEQ